MSSLITRAIAIGRTQATKYRPDTYEVIEYTNVADDAGGWVPSGAVVESGGCVLVAGNLRPDERVFADRAEAVIPYALRNMPYNSAIQPEHDVMVGGRTFKVLGVLRNEAANAAVTAICEERL